MLLVAIGVVLLINLISLLIPVIPSVLLSVAGRCLCRPTCPISIHMRLGCTGHSPRRGPPFVIFIVMVLLVWSPMLWLGRGPLRAACLLLVPGLRRVLSIVSALLHALRLLRCCLSNFKYRQPAIILKELAPFGKVAQVSICDHEAKSLVGPLSNMQSGKRTTHASPCMHRDCMPYPWLRSCYFLVHPCWHRMSVIPKRPGFKLYPAISEMRTCS